MAAPGHDRTVIRELREKVALGSRVLARFELVDYLGHLSARIPGSDLVLIRARGEVLAGGNCHGADPFLASPF